jgi:hypothetical protein
MPALNNQITVKNAALLILIMLLGLYLALGAIFSLSYIKDSPEARNSIVAQFDSLFIFKPSHFYADSTLAAESRETIKEVQEQIDDFYKYKVSPNLSLAPKSLQNKITGLLDNAHDSISIHMNYLTIQFELISKQLEDYLGQLKNIYIAGSSKFHIAALKLSSRLLTQYEQEWISYATDYETNLAASLHQNISNFRRNSAVLLNISKNAKLNIEILDIRIKKDTAVEITSTTLINFSFLPLTSTYSVAGIDSATLATLKKPVEGVIGQDWGVIFPKIIGFIAGSRNVDILLVFGMLGFGFFGAGIAIFISGASLENTNTGSYLLLIIVRGFSAAIVVYLAARGGIAVINKGVSDPDPLVLFLFCFIGAVFSERIWEWAKSRISTSFSGQIQEIDPQKNDTKTEKKQE